MNNNSVNNGNVNMGTNKNPSGTTFVSSQSVSASGVVTKEKIRYYRHQTKTKSNEKTKIARCVCRINMWICSSYRHSVADARHARSSQSN